MAIPEPVITLKRRSPFGANLGDRIFQRMTLLLAITVPIVILWLIYVLSKSAWPTITLFGGHFLTSATWDAVQDVYGALFAIWGTIFSCLLALLLAVPISLGAGIFLSELCPKWLRNPLSFLIELLAAVPSIVYGIWGVFVLIPLLKPVEEWLQLHVGYLPIFQGSIYGYGMLAAGIILAIMILPFITAVTREVLQAVPVTQREAAYALGATRWETLRGPVFRYARSGILGAIILGLGRAIGETMAVTMVIGNSKSLSLSLFNPAYTMPSLLANEFNEANPGSLQHASLVEVALILIILTIVINAIARLLIWRVSKGGRTEVQA
ncbi:MAG: phosphate ABC transporter permease subunit PstC [Armatimonadota bacterium]